MGYILKNTSGLVNTRLTDTGRLKLSQGNFNISYFQIGDSEVSYNTLPPSYNQFDTFILEPSFNAQNSAGVPQSNKENVKYPYYVDGITGNTYGIPYMDSVISPVYNRAVMRGFFMGDISGDPINWSALTNNLYAVNSNYVIQMNQLNGSDKIDLIFDSCNSESVRGPMVGDIITIYYDGNGLKNCDCFPKPSPSPSPEPSSTPTPTPTPSPSQNCLCVTFTCNDKFGGTVTYKTCSGDILSSVLTLGQSINTCIDVSYEPIIDPVDSISGNYNFGVSCKECSPSPQYCECITLTLKQSYSVKASTVVSFVGCGSDVGQFEDLSLMAGFSITGCFVSSSVSYDPSAVDITYNSVCSPFIECAIPLFKEPSKLNPCESPTPTPTPSATFCPTPTPSKACPPPPPPNCVVDTRSCYPILTYRIVDVCLNTITLDRPTPDFSYLTGPCYARTIIYPPSMVSFYDSYTPRPHWNDNVINFESVCYTDEFDVKIWNMNIPWSETPAGINSAFYKDYTQFGSIQYLGTKEYLGYASNSGQTDTDSVYYFNSFGDKIIVTPEEQKVIAIIHYTNQTVDFFYGEKFALEPFENVDDTTGQARNFRLHIPWLMWHKNPDCCHGQTFWVDPPGFEELELFKVHYIQSKKNLDMNTPGIRYYHLWDDNPNPNGYPNRIGKVFPDAKIIIIDDEEIIAAMSYKSNRNWTLPAPRLSLITPNTCGTDINSSIGILTGESETLYVTYRLTNTSVFTNSLHNNYYSVIQGPNLCLPFSSQNVAVRFGGEFNCLNQPFVPTTTTTTTFNPTTTTTTFNPTTTTTTSEPICGNCYEIIRVGGDVTVEYINCGGVPLSINVGDFIGTPKYVCSEQFPFTPLKVTINELGPCSPSTDCTPCWLTGFTFSFSGEIEGIIELSFIPTGQYTDGYPIFYCPVNSEISWNIFFDGSNWVWATVANYPITYTMFSGDSPINNFNFLTFTGETKCQEPNNLCLTINTGGTITNDNLITLFISGETLYGVYGNDIGIRCIDGVWNLLTGFSAPDYTGTTIATLDGVLCTEPPVGNWTFLGFGGVITTSSGYCTIECNCINLDNKGGDPINIPYMDCNGVLNEYTLDPFIDSDICNISINNYVPLTTGACTTVCTKLLLDNVLTNTTTYPISTTTTTNCPEYCETVPGFYADKFEIIVQKVPTGERPNPSSWKILDFTNQLSSTTINGFITQEGLTGNTFVITNEDYEDAPYYDLSNYIDITPLGYTGSQLNFGDEYYFYGNLETDIQATIYEMRYKINLGQAEFQTPSNPSWTSSNPRYVSEIGLYDNEKNLMIISKMQSPVLRQGIQQFLIKFDL